MSDEGPDVSVTVLLRAWRGGDRDALERLTPVVYGELRRLAGRRLRGERHGHTLTPTALVSEAFARLMQHDQPDWQDRAHFFAVAARNMRQILVDHARRRDAGKRGAGAVPITLDESAIGGDRPGDVLVLNDALDKLAAVDERKARAVELHYFAGMTHEDIAEVMGVHVNTVARDLRLAVAWLHRDLRA